MKNLIMLDFDSTISAVESLDFVVSLKYSRYYGFKNWAYKMSRDSSQGKKNGDRTERKIKFAQYLLKFIFRTRKSMLEECGEAIAKTHVSADMINFVQWAKNIPNTDVCIVSSGVKDIILPTAKMLNIPVYSADLEFSPNGNFIKIIKNGFERNKYIGVMRNIPIYNYDKTILIGDGYNDYEVFTHGVCSDYICFTQYQYREFAKHPAIVKAFSVTELRQKIASIINTQS